MVNGQAADAEAVQRLVDRISGLRVMGFAADDIEGLEPARVLEITDAAGSFQLSLAHDTKADEYVVGSDRVGGVRFTLASFIAEQILLDTEDLLAAEPDAMSVDESEEIESPAAAEAVEAPPA